MKASSKAAILDAYTKGYRVRDDGSLLNPSGRVLRGFVTEGYATFRAAPGGTHTIYVHVFAAYCRYGDKLFDVECVRHKDGDRSNCKRGNILLGSRSDNEFDKPKVVLLARTMAGHDARWGDANSRARRQKKVVALRGRGWSYPRIGQEVGLSTRHVWKILKVAGLTRSYPR